MYKTEGIRNEIINEMEFIYPEEIVIGNETYKKSEYQTSGGDVIYSKDGEYGISLEFYRL